MTHTLAPPGESSQISASRVLLLAPHADDDVLGCGGLLAQLADSGAAVRVLFLTDSSGGREVTTDREAYAERRQREAAHGLACLGVTDVDCLDLPDGELEQHMERAADGIRQAILDTRPEVLLSISPLEVTSDHQAAFAALHVVLSPLRGGSALDEAVADCRVLLYEINHPAFPNLLVDVSNDIERITAAIREHASQLEMHNYLEGAIGMRRHRTLSLPESVTAAEGYRELAVSDFTTSSLSGLIRRAGGQPRLHRVSEGPTVSVVVRTRDRQELLDEALASLAESTYRRVQLVLVNDGGTAPEVAADFPFEVARVDLDRNQGRATAANAGVDAATGDFVAFLDDDDLVEAEHLETLVNLVGAQGVRVAYTDAAVVVYELDGAEGWRQGRRRLPYSRDFDPELLLFDNYIPFNTLLIERSLFDEVGAFDAELPFFEDWDFLIRLARVVPFHHLAQVTAEYRHFTGGGHHVLGDRPHERSDFLTMKANVIGRYTDYHDARLLATVIDRLRTEAVDQGEAVAAARQAKAEAEDAFHRLNGENRHLKLERDRLIDTRDLITRERDELAEKVRSLAAEIQRLHGEESELRGNLDEQGEHLSRLYEEIERLNGVVEAMESTRAWRSHRFMERLRGR